MPIWKRLITVIVALVVLLSFLVSPAYAADTDDSIVNLMSPTNDYKLLSSYGTVKYTDNMYSFTTSKGASLYWNTDVSPRVNEIYITLHSTVDLPYLTVQINRTDVEITRFVKNGNSYFLTVATPNMIIQNITLALAWSSAISGKVSIVSAYAYYDEYYAFSNATIYTQDFLFTVDSDELFRSAYENKSVTSLPSAAINHITDYASEPVDPLLNGLIWIYGNKDVLPFDRAESITYMVSTCGSINTDELSFCLLDAQGKPKLVLPASKVSTVIRNTSVYFGSSDMQWPVYTYTITVDTTDLDLNYYPNFALHFWIDPVDIYYDDWTGWHFQLLSIVARPLQSTVPWYARFGDWINTGFTNVINALNGTSKSSELAAAGIAMENAATDIKSAGDALGAVSEPEFNSDDVFSGLTSFDPMGLTVLSCVTDNPLVTSMLVVVFTLCLAGYIFFGKKR